jgi:hypothetical protein
MNTTKLLILSTLAGALLTGSAAAATDDAAATRILTEWGKSMQDAVDTGLNKARMSYVTAQAEEALSKLACTSLNDGAGFEPAIKYWVNRFNLPVEYEFHGGCVLSLQKMTYQFRITKFIDETPVQAAQRKLDAARVDAEVAAWADNVLNFTKAIHSDTSLKTTVDTATSAATGRLQAIPCRFTSDANIHDIVAREVERRKLQLDYDASGKCVANKWEVTFKVTKIAAAFDVNKDAGGVSYEATRQATKAVDDFFAAAGQIKFDGVSWDKRTDLLRQLDQVVGDHQARIREITCQTSSTDRTAGFVQDLLTTKASEKRGAILVKDIRVSCNGGHLVASLKAEPVQQAQQPTITPGVDPRSEPAIKSAFGFWGIQMVKDLQAGSGAAVASLPSVLKSDNEKMRATLAQFGCVKDTDVNVKEMFNDQVRSHNLQDMFTIDIKCVSNKWSIVIAATAAATAAGKKTPAR